MPKTLRKPDPDRGWPTADQVVEFARLCPIGLDQPEAVPEEIFRAALKEVLECRRLDMQALAGELGIGRATLYRRVRSRDLLLGEVLWFLTRVAMARSLVRSPTRQGVEQVEFVIDRFMRDVHAQAALRRLLEAEPEIALRILTSGQGPVQRGIADVLERLLKRELQLDEHSSIDPAMLAFVIVRIGESFLYADVIAGHEADLDQASRVIAVLLRSSVTLHAV